MINVKIDTGSVKLSISCLICRESVELDEMELARLNHGLDIHSKICDNCKKAILHYRKELEEKESGED
ncbi:MAG: hypothetical protein J6R47_01885 [Acholeplasmatales bacterium]|nr:hypothetical protein [Acholeplasmatales bacterium]